ncbi:Methylcrotonoyl-CoA carboxylase subunit alpha, mitochondrial [Neolecta irregularis DAH-3]|uniref:Methylcrotonoyl-CoA carboxylase subunit alpha, mitochondrial n=1 Tax=Neolecta irregularis (strain DAH-3) TaxID=1198029 RepID=A0A1U7LP19_NEOID|nr:Methylcrotonoyl-CoA carboxylase subunit alpha, mitochondrial [Neolecta irregularis DAH-3]|eukprot:OLL24397.1 Methylcrotonoyl-CoA carboxylase subunit alpha, mitochondrial [Neolecta irregularis DAH-3]
MPPLFVAPLPYDPAGRCVVRKLLVANRGEIACRVIRSARKVGVSTVAIYTTPDKDSPHVRLADEAVHIGDIGEVNPHMNGQFLVETATRVGADSIHPGYGYLSENAGFAKLVQDSGLLFVGPSSESISLLGNKASAKEYLSKNASNVPLIPGYNGSNQTPSYLSSQAIAIGFPVLIKAAAGGGGKGMRIVRSSKGIEELIARAGSESQRSFGSSHLLVEKYIEKGKHIEVQIFGDNRGNIVCFFERECSVQRRHQKVIEETPSPWISNGVRQRMMAAATEIGRLIKYEGAGTVEFIVDIESSQFYFLEVNTRIQVEHPITEETVGVDLVALQLYVAAGGQLDRLPELRSLRQTGHAIECRLCAEDPHNDFLPCTGIIRRWNTAEELVKTHIPGLRYETGVETGSEISVFFDPMICKIIVHAETRRQAIHKLIFVLRHTAILGLVTNQGFLISCLGHEEFHKGEYTTGFIDSFRTELLFPPPRPLLTGELAIVPSLLLRHIRQTMRARSSFDTLSAGWRNNQYDVSSKHVDSITIDPSTLPAAVFVQYEKDYVLVWDEPAPMKFEGKEFLNKVGGQLILRYYNTLRTRKGLEGRTEQDWPFGVDKNMKKYDFHVDDIKIDFIRGKWMTADMRLSINGIQRTYFAATDTSVISSAMAVQNVFVLSSDVGFGIKFSRRNLLTYAGKLDERISGEDLEGGEKRYLTPMPCKILIVLASDGARISKGDGLVIMESMKTEVKIAARTAGLVKMKVRAGQVLGEGETICEIEQDED